MRLVTDTLRHRYGTAHLGSAVALGLARNDLEAFAVALARTACEWCGSGSHRSDDCE